MSNLQEQQPVFDIPELLEAILCHLPANDILLNKAVCKTWKNCIEASIKIKMAMFLLADGKVWPMISDMLIFQRLLFAPLTSLEEIPSEDLTSPCVRLNPALKKHLIDLNAGNLWYDETNRLTIRGSVPESEVNWKNMLLTQPPVRERWARLSFGTPLSELMEREKLQRTWLRLRNVDGLTMGDVMRAIRRAARGAGFKRFSDRHMAFVMCRDLWDEEFIARPTV